MKSGGQVNSLPATPASKSGRDPPAAEGSPGAAKAHVVRDHLEYQKAAGSAAAAPQEEAADAGRGERPVGVRKMGKISKILQTFGGLVLGCIKTKCFLRDTSSSFSKFCKKKCVWQHFSSFTRFAYFCTAAISKFWRKIGLKKQQFL